MTNRMLIFSIICLTMMSCNNSEIDKLKSEVIELKSQNKKLASKLQQNEIKRFTSSFFIVTSKDEYLTVNSKNELKISLATIDTIPKFDIYSVDEEYNRTLIMEGLTQSVFKYSFVPRSVEDNEINFQAELELSNGDVLNFPINSKFIVKEK